MNHSIFLYGRNSEYGPDYSSYIDAYIQSYIIVEKGLKDRYEINDYNYYPLIYLLFHILELSLKNISDVYSSYFPSSQIKRTHDLINIWSSNVKSILKKFPSKITDRELDTIEKLIQRYQELGKCDQIFKYPDTEIHPHSEIDVTHLIKSIPIDSIKNLNSIFHEIKILLRNMQLWGFDEAAIGRFESLVSNPLLLVNKQLLYNLFGDKYFEACLILKENYKLKYDKDCKLKPNLIDISVVDEIVRVGFQRRRRYNKIMYKERGERIIPVTIEEIEALDRDDDFQNLAKRLQQILISLTTEELWDLKSLMSLGRGKISLAHYYLSFDKRKQSKTNNNEKEQIVREISEKIRLGEYLKRALEKF